MTAATGNEWDEIVRTWGHAYTLSHHPDLDPSERYAAQPVGTQIMLMAETPAALLDVIKDDAATRLLTVDPT
jgi:hypothetical protein